MHPAFSVIAFTSLSGMGYGLAVVLGVGLLDGASLGGQIGYVIALLLISAGLASSTFHLGHPERAILALTQWRSSWLSREGVLAIITFLPLGLAALGSLFFAADWRPAGWLAAAGSVATVYCTAMIYASLKTVQQWASGLTVAVYLLFGLAGGLLLASGLAAVDAATAYRDDSGRSLLLLSVLVLLAAWVSKALWWRRAGQEHSASTIESATGLGHLGKVRLLERPHIEENYLTREMGFRVARKHAVKLRRMALIFGLVLPLAALLVALVIPDGFAAVLLLAAALCHLLGVLIERWLFFAEARHTVMLYYGDERA